MNSETIPAMENLLMEDFKAKLDYLKDQYTRLWQRLGFFLTIETALFGYFGWLAFEKDNLHATRLPAIFGICVSAIWYVIAAQDRALVVQYREHLRMAAERIGEKTDRPHYSEEHPGAEVSSHFTSLVCWYWRPISITKLPGWISLALLALWLLLTMFGESLLGNYR